MGEMLEIPDCPICGGKHIYKLEVERTFVIKLMNIGDSEERPQPVRFTRIFVCPVRNEKFQASFKLYQTSDSIIKSVKVEGVIENEKE
jgi:hypothetical protein